MQGRVARPGRAARGGADGGGRPARRRARPHGAARAPTSTAGWPTASAPWPRPIPTGGSSIDGSRSVDEVEAAVRERGAGAATTPGVIDPWAEHRRPGPGRGRAARRGRGAGARLPAGRPAGQRQAGAGRRLRRRAAQRGHRRARTPTGIASWRSPSSTPTSSCSSGRARPSARPRPTRSSSGPAWRRSRATGRCSCSTSSTSSSPATRPSCSRSSRSRRPGTFFVVLVEHVPAELVTIASRACASTSVRCPTRPSSSGWWPRASTPEIAAEVGVGRVGRPRAGPGCWPPIPASRCAGPRGPRCPTSSTAPAPRATQLVDELFAMIDDAAAPLRERQTSRGRGARGARRPARRAGLGPQGARGGAQARAAPPARSTSCASACSCWPAHYRDELAVSSRPAPLVEALDAIQATSEALIRNPNETLQFQALFLRLGAAA